MAEAKVDQAAGSAANRSRPRISLRCCRRNSNRSPIAPARKSKRRCGPWRAGAGGQDLIADDAVNSINAIVAEIDRKLAEQVNLIMHNAQFQAARELMARPALPGQQHRDRRDAEDQGLQHFQEGARQDPEEIQGHRLGSESHLQEGSTRSSTVSSAVSPTAVWWAIIISITARRMWNCCPESPRSPPLRMRLSSRPLRPPPCKWTRGGNSPIRAI
jgi:hypothetical protein